MSAGALCEGRRSGHQEAGEGIRRERVPAYLVRGERESPAHSEQCPDKPARYVQYSEPIAHYGIALYVQYSGEPAHSE